MRFLDTTKYCRRCGTVLTQYSSGYGWCHHCGDLVHYTRCKVPHWIFGVIVFLAYNLHMDLLT